MHPKNTHKFLIQTLMAIQLWTSHQLNLLLSWYYQVIWVQTGQEKIQRGECNINIIVFIIMYRTLMHIHIHRFLIAPHYILEIIRITICM